MDIEFDSTKEAANIVKHGISLALAAKLLEGDYNVRADNRNAYGENRFVAIGSIDDRLHVCVFTMRGAVYRIISLRRANRREINDYS